MTENDYLEIVEDVEGEYRWHRKAGNHEIISVGESHPTERGAVAAALRANLDLTIEDVREPHAT